MKEIKVVPVRSKNIEHSLTQCNATSSDSSTTSGAEDRMESVFFSDLIDPVIKLIPVFTVFKVKQVFLSTRICRQGSEGNPYQTYSYLTVKSFSE